MSNVLKDTISGLMARADLSEDAKNHILKSINRLNEQKIHILITGATGCGKSSTINALFGHNRAKVGQGVDPETMDIKRFDLENIVLWDSPGLGDGKEADNRHAKNIIDKLNETDANGKALIDLVLVILDGSSRDLGTSYELINQVIIPNLGDNTDRLLVAINQCDMAMKGRHWDHQNNKPESELESFLKDKVHSTRNRVKEATGVDIEPIYYSAGYKDGDDEQKPYNLSKLLYFIVTHTKPEKRAVYLNDVNQDKSMWQNDDELDDYRGKVQKSIFDSIKESAQEGADYGASIGAEIGNFFGAGRVGEAIGRAAGSLLGGIVGGFKSLFGR